MFAGRMFETIQKWREFSFETNIGTFEVFGTVFEPKTLFINERFTHYGDEGRDRWDTVTIKVTGYVLNSDGTRKHSNFKWSNDIEERVAHLNDVPQWLREQLIKLQVGIFA